MAWKIKGNPTKLLWWRFFSNTFFFDLRFEFHEALLRFFWVAARPRKVKNLGVTIILFRFILFGEKYQKFYQSILCRWSVAKSVAGTCVWTLPIVQSFIWTLLPTPGMTFSAFHYSIEGFNRLIPVLKANQVRIFLLVRNPYLLSII